MGKVPVTKQQQQEDDSAESKNMGNAIDYYFTNRPRLILYFLGQSVKRLVLVGLVV
jgi:hypothetical protein